MTRNIAWALVGLAAAACSGSGGGGGVSAQQACQDEAHQRCTRLEACAPGRIQTQFGDEGTCESRYALTCTSALAAPNQGNTPATLEACAQAIPGWACTDFLDDQNAPSACVQQTGSVASGGACGFAGQCQSGYCAIAPNALCGTCAAPPSAGDSCAQLSTCGQGLFCTEDTQTCVVVAAQGAACGKGAPCGASLFCVGENATKGVQGTCQPAVAQAGASCDPTGQSGPGCDHNQLLACNTQTKQCATLTVAGSGQPCGTNDVDGQTALCGAGGVCTGASTGKPGTCTAAAADGAACDAQSGPGCMLLSRCVSAGDGGTAGTCQTSSASCQ